ncbi:MAG: FAD-dependent oxidoreductase, partial [Planctomycetota bacterium]
PNAEVILARALIMVPMDQAPSPSGTLLILGGGIAGLAAADEACRAGVQAIVVEVEARPGGLLRTDRRDGFCFDRGGHRFITSIPWVLERVRDLLADRLLVRERRSLILLDGTTIEYPLRIANLLRRLGPWRNVRALLSYLAARDGRGRAPEEQSLEEWLRGHFGCYLYRAIFEGYSEKLWGEHPSRISAEWAPERISIPTLGGFLKELLLPSRRAPRTYARRYLYPRRGIGEIAEAFADRVEEGGGEIWTSSRALAVSRKGRVWRAAVETARGERAVEAGGVVSTIPLASLLEILEEPEKPELLPLQHRGLRFLNLAFRRPVPLDATWIYHPDRDSRFSRIQVPAARSPHMVPPEHGSIQLEEPWWPGSAEEGEAQAGHGRGAVDAAGRIDEAMALLGRLDIDPGEPLFSFTTVEPHAYPIYRPGARQSARRALAWLHRLPGLASAGRQGGFSYIFLDRALAQGVNAARHVLGLEALDSEGEGAAASPLPIEASSVV